MAICTKWAVKVQRDVPKALAATMNLKPTILIPYFSLLKSRYNCVNDGGVFGSGVRKRRILCLCLSKLSGLHHTHVAEIHISMVGVFSPP